ncbi:MAG TPA: F0F1 ATP synthase subunit A [Bacteroidota bacterium]|nr:F0F1 ATP synthase subunit A [Bacteroidota bacterium]
MRISSSTTSDTLQTSTSDSLQAAGTHGAAADGHGDGFDFNELLHHLYDSRELELPGGAHVGLPQFPPIQLGGLTIDLSITKHVFFLFVAATLLIVAATLTARSLRKKPVPSGFANLMEIFVVFIRDEIVIPNMGKAGLQYMPYLLTTFFYILIMNLMGLLPYGATATGNLSVTAALAAIAFVMIQFSAIRAQGLKHYLAHLTGGVAWWLWPIMIPIEILGLFTKPFALCMRLFANMTGGHIVLLSLLGFIFIAQSYVFSAVPIVFVVGISMLELFVAFLQAYIFTMLTSLFMGLGMPQEGHAEHGEGHH